MRGRFSSTSTGTRYPDFTNVAVQDFHDVVSAKFGGGKIMFSGYEANGRHFPLGIVQNNVVFDGTQPTFEKGAATHDTPGPGAVSFFGSIVTSSANDVTVTGTPGTSTPYDCSAAFTTLKSVAPASPIRSGRHARHAGDGVAHPPPVRRVLRRTGPLRFRLRGIPGTGSVAADRFRCACSICPERSRYTASHDVVPRSATA